jgi:(+)-pinoresinol hydroxylase
MPVAAFYCNIVYVSRELAGGYRCGKRQRLNCFAQSLAMHTPPGVSERDFADALRQFERVVGHEWVFSSEEDVALYRDAYSPFWGEPDERVASAAVAPDTVAQVQEIVRIANRLKVPLYPISTGRDLGYGGSAPTYSGSVVLDLKRMNRILEVNERNASALVEPGVSYFDLYNHIQERGLKLWLDVPDPGWGSPIGNSLDRGGGYTMPQYRFHFEAHCGMEVVLPNGELMRTGQGAMPGSRTWQEFKNAVGPSVDGLFSQANFGVVTKMGFWLMPEPEAYLSATVFVPRYVDLVPLVDAVNYLENSGITNGIPELSSPVMKMAPAGGETPTAELRALIDSAVQGDGSGLDAYGQSKGVPAWSCKLKFYGPPAVILEQWRACKARLSRIAGATFDDGTVIRTPLTAEQKEQLPKAEFGIPALSIWGLISRSAQDRGPHYGHQGFSPIIPRSGEAVFESNRIFARAARDFGLPVPPYSVPHCYWQRAFMFIFLFPVSKDAAANAKARTGLQQLVKLAAEAGFGEYRCAPAYQDLIARTYSFNNNALLRFQETLKDAIDPNGILSPGRYGIWPRHLRPKSS